VRTLFSDNPDSNILRHVSETEHDKRRAFLCKTLTYGHLDLLSIQDVDFISRSQFYSTLNPSNATEQWFWELLTKTNDEVKFACLKDSLSSCRRQHLFFSEPEVFLTYLEKGTLPLFILETQVRVVLITRLPDDLLGLFEPSRFWERWVSALF
jgi:hypothetical protein